MNSLPYRLHPKFVERVWGTTKLAPYFPDADRKIGEVWFTPEEGDYPVLVKFIFTSERLSVQVHPDDDYARRHENSRGKTEMWHILGAEPGAQIAIGFQDEISPERLRDAIADGSVERMLNWVPVAPGETYFTRAGVVHAIGAGVTLCEIQQNSDVTYRLYDYGRGRELHIAKAFDVLESCPYDGLRAMPVRCEHFATEKIDMDAGPPIDVGTDCLLVVTAGEGAVGSEPFRQGDVWRIPDGASATVSTRNPATLLRVSCGGTASGTL
jgi:mannose-6-phosphate isomerase